jgi:hypothetical protein
MILLAEGMTVTPVKVNTVQKVDPSSLVLALLIMKLLSLVNDPTT